MEKIVKLGFTGTRNGLTEFQRKAFEEFVCVVQPTEFHHGDCIGADSQAHDIVRRATGSCLIVGHPANLVPQRAYRHCDIEMRPEDPLVRNKAIVAQCDFLVACPKGFQEELRSGTWATWRNAIRRNRMRLMIFPGPSDRPIGQFDTLEEFAAISKEQWESILRTVGEMNDQKKF